MRILGIETSCDETGVAIVENGTNVKSNVIATSKDAYGALGGVIPEHAARKQMESILHVIDLALKEADVDSETLDAIAVTRGPGLLVSLLVGTTVARTLHALWNVPLIGVHHTLGHLSSPWLEQDNEPRFPSITLSASGGHTELWYRTGHTRGTLLGSTRDDAAGEAFDKGAQLLGLPYPGGPSIANAARHGNPKAFRFPSPLANSQDLSLSFSGLKTALRYTLRDLHEPSQQTIADLAASYQQAICRHLADRLLAAVRVTPDICEVHLVGGVSANTALRTMLTEALGNLPLRTPSNLRYCTDNGAMIAAAANFLYAERGKKAFEPFETVAALPLSAALEH
ncbi:tRNA (adenosine(37)-N6)-threonylcarbamoyltransferase complex transferase subunit TsaD [Candidatus Peregrinibacteria bacterium CG10_big_fil_rev_8_21_14_0_10_55_24]|nr:MAG: tRNA (adenosine(37)-N6)-threonylcarbamoyltransferase complex transferase subunit TsaD [Candidatus Peregrinibacteria bacterium CG10_big_fil_rev_8_21_14_0_10_55_24]